MYMDMASHEHVIKVGAHVIKVGARVINARAAISYS